MAEGNFRTYLQKERVRAKKYFYVLRPLLACDWIKETNTMAPTEFQILVDTQVKDSDLKQEIDNLLARKTAGEELNEWPKIQLINNFLEQMLDYYSTFVQSLEKQSPPDTERLNALFKSTLNEAWK
jgi:hypothetical protein